eukprot:sb/3477527/
MKFHDLILSNIFWVKPNVCNTMYYDGREKENISVSPRYTGHPDLPGKTLSPEHPGKSGSDCMYMFVQSDPDLVTSSGERVLVTKSGWALNRGQIPLISYIGGNLSRH